jgi:chemotaxis signal transduction protein
MAAIDAVAITDAAVARARPETLYQGIRCGPVAFAISYRWARSIAESFDEVPIPRAPIWLTGAASIEGHIRPIIDLALLAAPDYRRTTVKRDLRLLLGGHDDGDLTDPPIALLFEGLPQQLRAFDDDIGVTIAGDAMPAQIASAVEGSIRSTRDELFYVVNIAKLANGLASELSVL